MNKDILKTFKVIIKEIELDIKSRERQLLEKKDRREFTNITYIIHGLKESINAVNRVFVNFNFKIEQMEKNNVKSKISQKVPKSIQG